MITLTVPKIWGHSQNNNKRSPNIFGDIALIISVTIQVLTLLSTVVVVTADSTYFSGSKSSQLKQHSLTEPHPKALVPFPLKTSDTIDVSHNQESQQTRKRHIAAHTVSLYHNCNITFEIINQRKRLFVTTDRGTDKSKHIVRNKILC